VIFFSMTAFLGERSASTKLVAKLCTSMPEPAPKAVMALEVDVVAVVAVVPEVELTVVI
jgi:hypothetical protein